VRARPVYARKRVLGICFGHQVLCRALGGKVGKARNGWDVGVRKVTFARDLLEGLAFPGDLVEELELPRSASLVEVHQDEVWEIPPAVTVLAYSEKTRVEVFAVGEHALGVQGHPEYTVDILHNLIDSLTNQKAIRRSVGEEARRTVAETGGPDLTFWTALCKTFLGRGGGGDHPQPTPPVRETMTPEVTSCAVACSGCFTGAAAMVQLA
jgi:glucosinolate gamma-glutamyl hydrolase